MKQHPAILFGVLLALNLVLSACSGGQVAASSLSRNTAPEVPEADSGQLVAGNSAFAFDLYQSMRSSPENLVFSPYSISLAFTMTYAGARSETAVQMADVFHFTLTPEALHPAFNALDLELARRPEQAAGVDKDDRFDLTIANALWGEQDWPFLPEFLDLLAVNYGAGMRLVDFQGNAEAARRQINDWVSDQTHKRIQDILAPGVLDSATRLVLANAIYFKATWEHEFEANDTSDREFHLLDGSTVTVPTMEQETTYAYASGDGWQAVALPYRGGLADMLLIVPDEGKFEDFEAALTPELYAEIVSALEPQRVILSMPKFTFETSTGLSDLLVAMGMPDAFDPGRADFSGMDGAQDLYISDALHKAFIAVDEKGTEAAAATIVIMALTSMMPEGVELTIDHPFLFAIRDVPSGTLLFLGRVLDPR